MPFANTLWRCPSLMPFTNALRWRLLPTPFTDALRQCPSLTPLANALGRRPLSKPYPAPSVGLPVTWCFLLCFPLRSCIHHMQLLSCPQTKSLLFPIFQPYNMVLLLLLQWSHKSFILHGCKNNANALYLQAHTSPFLPSIGSKQIGIFLPTGWLVHIPGATCTCKRAFSKAPSKTYRYCI